MNYWSMFCLQISSQNIIKFDEMIWHVRAYQTVLKSEIIDNWCEYPEYQQSEKKNQNL